jgi:hypothetical protein
MTIVARLCVLSAATLVESSALADETGHYTPGVMSIRDLAMPDPGFYVLVYNYLYDSERLNDSNGDAIDSVEIGRGRRATEREVRVDLNLYALSPVLLWVSDWKIAGAKLGAYIAPSFANASVDAALSTATLRGGGVSSSSFNVGDMFVQPVWLGWGLKNWDLAFGYGFYAPIGAYDTETVDIPVVGERRVESSDSIGLGFWTHQLQGTASWYPWEDKRMAVTGGLTYEFHSQKRDFDLTPGQNLSLNWGVSQYLPMTSDASLLAEIGVTGYDTWQTTEDEGRDASDRSLDQVHAVGGQLGVTYVPWILAVNLHVFYEFAADDRFQGVAFGINIAKKVY